MKHYLIEPTRTKCVLEREQFDKPGSDHILTMETGWRWGAFIIDVPETDEEIQQYLSQRNYDSLASLLADCSAQTLEQALLPSEDAETVDLSDYEHDLLHTDDGWWCDVGVFSAEMTEEELEDLKAQLQELYDEEGYDGLESDGWQSLGTEYYIDCPSKVTPCDNDGNPLGETA